jgi:hypothetical protein
MPLPISFDAHYHHLRELIADCWLATCPGPVAARRAATVTNSDTDHDTTAACKRKPTRSCVPTERIPEPAAHDYDEFSSYSLTYHRAIFRAPVAPTFPAVGRTVPALSRRPSPTLAAGQRAVLDKAEAIAADPGAHGAALTDAKHAEFRQLGTSVREAFGAQEASGLLGALGPGASVAFGPQKPADPDRNCSMTDDWCGGPTWCRYDPNMPCNALGGCGTQWVYECNGLYMAPT